MRQDSEILDSFGSLLTAWQRSRRYRLSELSKRLPSKRGDTAIANMKAGRRVNITKAQLDGFDDALKAGGAFADLVRALGTRGGLPPRSEWTHNFDNTQGSVWFWIRMPIGTPQLRAELHWGPLKLSVDRPIGDEGLFITSPSSVSNPPLVVSLDGDGWVDFGRGRLPRGLGLPVMAGIRHTRLDRSNITVRQYSAFFDNLLRRLSSNGETASALPDSAEAIMEQEFGHLAIETVTLWYQELVEEFEAGLLTGPELKVLREHRMLSGQETLRLANELPLKDGFLAFPINRKIFDRVEARQMELDSGVRSRLDVLYGADGWATCEAVSPNGAPQTQLRNVKGWSFQFPDYWVGPVWLDVDASASDHVLPNGSEIVLRWGPWSTRVVMDTASGCFTFRQAGPSPALEVFAPASWNLTAGMGRKPKAVKLDEWAPGDRDGADHIYKVMRKAYLRVVQGSPAGLARLVRRLARQTT